VLSDMLEQLVELSVDSLVAVDSVILPMDSVVDSDDSVVGVLGVDSDVVLKLLSVDNDRLLVELAEDRDIVE